MIKTISRKVLSVMLSLFLLIGMVPVSVFAETVSAPFTAAVNGEAMTDITQSTLQWTDWNGTTSDVTAYTVSVPQGSTEATLTFDEEKQCCYYNSAGEWIANINGDSSMTSDTSHIVAIQDSNNDGELDGISVQIPDAYATEYYIQFVYASGTETVSCVSVLADAPVTGTVGAGGLYQLNLNTVFADSEGHSLTYSFETSVENEHTQIADGVFYFSASEMGDYEVTFTAKCDSAEISHKITVTVEEADEGIAAQYGYDETDKSSVTVYVTLSNDGYPVVAADGTVMSNLMVTVPYFDLGLYGLGDYYRYGTDGGKGTYTNDKVVQRPTGLHLYIYLLERYYMGLDESQCCLGTSGVLKYAEDTEVYYMDGGMAYESGGKRALMTSGGATSIYMVNFWGHDENLMYFRNHCYPYMSAGWGATSDYILRSDGDTWDVGMFSNWSFNKNGFFARFDADEYTAQPNEEVVVKTQKWGTSSAATDFEAVNGSADMTVALYNSDWEHVKDLKYDNESGNTITFTAPETAGTYYIMATDPNVQSNEANIAPATARVIVAAESSDNTSSGSEDEQVAVSRILLNDYEETLSINGDEKGTLQLAATVLPAEATGWTISWTSSDADVATVDESGLVTAVGEGTATITAAIGDIKAECAVTVEKYNTAPTVVSGAASRAKIKTNEEHTVDVSSMFTDEQNDTLTYTVELKKASSYSSSFNYIYGTTVESIEPSVDENGSVSVTVEEKGIYALVITASDGKLEKTHTYQLTVTDNDAGKIEFDVYDSNGNLSTEAAVTLDLYNVVVVDSSEEFAKDFEIPNKGTHDTYIHNIVLSKDTVSGGPHRRMDISNRMDGCNIYQYSNKGTAVTDGWGARGDIGLFVDDADNNETAHFLRFFTECAEHTDADKDAVCDVCTMDFSCESCTDADSNKYCDVCGKFVNNAPNRISGVDAEFVQEIQTGLSYQLDDLINGKVFEDKDGDTLTYESYFYRKSSDGGETWGELTGFAALEHGGYNTSLSNSTEGRYIYEFVAYDGYEYSTDTWTLILDVKDVVTADVNFYVGRDQNYDTHEKYPVLELYKTAGIDENLYDYVGWFTNAKGETEYVYNPAKYNITTDEEGNNWVVINEKPYQLYGYEKIEFTNSAFDDSDETATASGTLVGDYNMFYASVESGRYSTRAYGYNSTTGEYDVYLGGQSMELPMEKDIYGGGGGDIYLRVVSVYTTSKKTDNTYFTADDYYAEMIMPVTGSMIHSGDAYVNGNYTYYPFMSYAAGNASLYNIYAYPYDTDNYIFNQSINNTTTAGYKVVNKSVPINPALLLTVNVPKDADFGLYFQYNNFNTKEVEPEGKAVVNGDTKTLVYKVSKSNSNYTWRLTDPSGKYVDKAGWLASLTALTEKTFTFSEATDNKSHDFNNLGTAVKTRDEADIQVFLDHSGFMSTNDSYRVRAFRMWQLINSDSGNIMVEPKMNVQVLKGNASDVTQVSGGNAEGNWIDVKPTTTDIIAVNYDAIDMYSTEDNYGSHGGLFPATNPERTGVFVITNEAAGTADAVISLNGGTDTDRGAEWDYNYDTWFYDINNVRPMLDFTVTSANENPTVEYSTVITDNNLDTAMGKFTTLTADENGRYEVPLIGFLNAGTKGGTVIIKMTDSTGTSYRLVRVAEMSVTVTNNTIPDEPFTPGDSVTVTFDGLYRSVNKVAGIFNPTTYYLRYNAGETQVNGKLGQYQQMDRATITFTIPADITFPEGKITTDYTFTNGHIYGSMYSASSPFSTLYEMTDTGVGTNFSAVGVSFVLSNLADITVQVEEKTYYDLKVNVTDGSNALSGYTFMLYGTDGNELTADENGIYQDLPYGSYKYSLELGGYIKHDSVIKIGSADAGSVKDGILTKDLVLVKAAEGAWDGTTKEPAAIDGVYQIGTGAELAWFAQTVNAGTTDISAVLTADIDLAKYDWTPIGTSSNKFAGSFDGQNHKISNLYISTTTGATYLGLFGNVTGSSGAPATVRNLTVEGEITATSTGSVSTAYIAGAAGSTTNADITNVHSDVDVTITRVKGNWARVGGIAGGISNTTIKNCSNTGNIAGYQYVGGIAGYETSDSVIEGCFNTGSISGYQYIGGIAGSNAGSKISTSYNTGAISSTSNFVGGIAGNCAGASVVVTNCFTTGEVTFGGTTVNAGAVAGQVNNASATVSNVYYLDSAYTTGIGKVTGTHTVTALTVEQMAAGEFVATMNTGLETAAFAKGEHHPVLIWQADIEPTVAVTGVTLDKETLSLTVGKTAALTATVTPTEATDKSVTWISSDEAVATVDENGVVTAVKAGEATITVTTKDGGFTDECKLEVVAEAAQIVYGDVSGDGNVNMDDVTLVLGHINGTTLTETTATAAADVNCDGNVNMDDITIMLQFINGTITQLPVEAE